LNRVTRVSARNPAIRHSCEYLGRAGPVAPHSLALSQLHSLLSATIMTPEQKNRVTDLAEELGSYLDDESKLRTAIMSTLKTAYRNHQVHISSASSPPSPKAPIPHTTAQALTRVLIPATVAQNTTPPTSDPIEESCVDNAPDTRQSRSTSSSRKSRPGPRLLSPSVARARYRKMLNAAVQPDDVSVFSEFLTPSDYESEWDRIAEAAAQSKTTNIPISSKTTNTSHQPNTTNLTSQPKTTNLTSKPKTTNVAARKTKNTSFRPEAKNMPAKPKTTKLPRPQHYTRQRHCRHHRKATRYNPRRVQYKPLS